MKGRVVFWYAWPIGQDFPEGVVLFKLFGQKCRECKSESFEHAMWYPEEVTKVGR